MLYKKALTAHLKSKQLPPCIICKLGTISMQNARHKINTHMWPRLYNVPPQQSCMFFPSLENQNDIQVSIDNKKYI